MFFMVGDLVHEVGVLRY